MTKQKGHGFIRKSKAYGLVCGIALAGTLAFAQGVSADEVTATAEATTTEDVAPTQEVVAQSEDLTKAVEVAKEAGVEITQTETESVSSETQAQADYTSQVASLEAVAQQQVAQDKAYEAKKAEVIAENEANKEAVEKRNAANKAANEAENAAIAKQNQEAMAKYNKELKDQVLNAKSGYFSDKEVQDFLKPALDNGKAVRVLNPKTNNNKVTADNSKLEKLTDAKEFEAYYQAAEPSVDNDQLRTIFNNGQLYKIKVGDTITYKGLFAGESGKDIVTKVTITGIDKPLPNHNFTLVGVNPNYPDFNGFVKDGGITYKLENFYSDGSKAIENYLVGIGDMDWMQEVNLITPANTVLFGSNVNKVSNTRFTTKNKGIPMPSDPEGQLWLSFVNTNTFEFTYRANDKQSNGHLERAPFWHAIGGIDLQLDMPVVPEMKKPKPFTPETFTPKELPKAPDKLKVNWHLNQYPVTLKTVKDVLNADGVSVNNGELKLGEKGVYTLEGAKILAYGTETLTKYDFVDMLDKEHDKYLGYKVYAFTPIKLTDGTVLKTMDDLKAFAQQSYDEATGKFFVSLNSDFLAKVAKDSDFQAKVEVEFERIKAGEVENVFTNNLAFTDKDGKVTEVPVPSNKVKTHTPEDPKPTPPAPEAPKPVAQANVLPSTGEEGSILAVLGSALLAGLSLVGIRKRKEN